MKVLMLGWEYPPHISGGLGTACAGLAEALARCGVEVTIALPHLYGGENPFGVRLVDVVSATVVSPGSTAVCPSDIATLDAALEERLRTWIRPAPPSYGRGAFGDHSFRWQDLPLAGECEGYRERMLAFAQHYLQSMQSGELTHGYSGDMWAATERYAALTVARFSHGDFDVIHAHDWMTVPAALALRAATGHPVIFHVHSLEFDRSGESRNQRIHEIEGLGIHEADRVVTVSHYTAGVVRSEHGLPRAPLIVVHNGIYPREIVQSYRREQGAPKKVVLFLGRVTFQKGPDYFVEAAARVIPHYPEVRFVIAGAGDMLPQLQQRVRELGFERHFSFPGFLRGLEVEQMFSMADLYVMPSVSEPFGLSALEALQADTPVILSKQSGVGEVVSHALKVDFWDIERLADLMLNVLLHPELSYDMLAMARSELARVRWEAAALRILGMYREIMTPALTPHREE